MAVAIARNREGYLDELAAAVQDVGRDVATCKFCGSLTSNEKNPCYLCTDSRRDTNVICVVENPADSVPLWSCVILGIGLTIHFSRSLFLHIRRQARRNEW